MKDGTRVELLRCKKRKSLLKIETHLHAENRNRAGTGTIGLLRAMIQNMLEKGKVLLHREEKEVPACPA